MRVFKKILFLFFLFFLFTCSQDKFADIVYKNKNIIYGDKENYIENPGGKILKSLRGKNTNIDSTANIIKDGNNIKVNNDYSGDNYHVVKQGENLWTISKQYGIKLNELVSLNNLEKPYKIKVGQKLNIGINGSNTSYNDSRDNSTTNTSNNLNNIKTTIYVVKKGDVLSKIANKFNTTSSHIAELNNLEKPYKIKVGQKLNIKTSVSSIKNTEQVIVKNDKKEIKVKNIERVENESFNITNKINKFIWPIRGKVVSSFGSKNNGLFNDGINISAVKGSGFVATEDGTVAYVGNELRGYGIIILIKHSNGWISAYAHCDTSKVQKGDNVKKGQVIGTVGQSGNVSFSQLYFSLRKGKEPVDPIKYFGK